MAHWASYTVAIPNKHTRSLGAATTRRGPPQGRRVTSDARPGVTGRRMAGAGVYGAVRLGNRYVHLGFNHPPPRVVALQADMGMQMQTPIIDIHGRHVDVDTQLEQMVKDRLQPILKKVQSPEFLESEGGIKVVDVRLMNSQAQITMHPEVLNKHLHDTFLQRGALIGIGQGSADALSNFEMAAQQLEKKLHKWSKGKVMKKDFRRL